MDCVCKYNKKRDIAETTQSGYVNLDDLLGKGIIPEGLNVTEQDFNNIEEPRSIYGRPQDQFDAMTMAKDLQKRGAQAQKLADDRAAVLAAAEGK